MNVILPLRRLWLFKMQKKNVKKFLLVFLLSCCCPFLVTQAALATWQDKTFSSLNKAFKVGYDRKINRQLYVCRTHLWGGRQLGMTWQHHGRCHIPYARKNYVVDNYSVLNSPPGFWQPYYGFFPERALYFGEGVQKVPLALCRGFYHRSLLPGKIWRGHKFCEVVYHGKAISLSRFSVFIALE